jgi:catechol 2,3-dioxygenase-like lactoylglutathione lyase family enzyme
MLVRTCSASSSTWLRLSGGVSGGRLTCRAALRARAVPWCDVATDDTTSLVAWVALTIDCPDARVQERLRHFYAQALGGEIVGGSVRARGWLLVPEVIDDYRPPTWPSGQTPKQMHFEWMVDDLEGAVTRLRGLGATLAEHQPEDGGWRVLLDPAGHPFCVATTTGVPPVFRDEASRQHR